MEEIFRGTNAGRTGRRIGKGRIIPAGIQRGKRAEERGETETGDRRCHQVSTQYMVGYSEFKSPVISGIAVIASDTETGGWAPAENFTVSAK